MSLCPFPKDFPKNSCVFYVCWVFFYNLRPLCRLQLYHSVFVPYHPNSLTPLQSYRPSSLILLSLLNPVCPRLLGRVFPGLPLMSLKPTLLLLSLIPYFVFSVLFLWTWVPLSIGTVLVLFVFLTFTQRNIMGDVLVWDQKTDIRTLESHNDLSVVLSPTT